MRSSATPSTFVEGRRSLSPCRAGTCCLTTLFTSLTLFACGVESSVDQSRGEREAPPSAAPCGHDPDCVEPRWWPGAGYCAELERCLQGRCRLPPTVDGARIPGKTGVLFGVGGFRLTVELAETPFEQARGLSCRPPLRPGWGMYFPLPKRAEWEVSGALMTTALKLLMLGESGELLQIETLEPAMTKRLSGERPLAGLVELSIDAASPAIGTRLELVIDQ